MKRDGLGDEESTRDSFVGICGATGSRGIAAQKQSSSIGQDEIPPNSPVRSVLRLIALDDELYSDRQGILRHTQPDELVRGAAFNQPRHHRAIRALDVDVEP